MVVEDIPPFYVKCFEYPVKHYINVTNYYYYLLINYYMKFEGVFENTNAAFIKQIQKSKQ